MDVLSKIQKWYRLSFIFVRLVFAFINPFHELWLDTIVIKIWKLALEAEDIKELSSELLHFAKEIEKLAAEYVRCRSFYNNALFIKYYSKFSERNSWIEYQARRGKTKGRMNFKGIYTVFFNCIVFKLTSDRVFGI